MIYRSLIVRIAISALLFDLASKTAWCQLKNITVATTPVVVFDHSKQCETLDMPDEPVRAFRRSDNTIVALATHYLNRRLVGPALLKLSNDCRLIYQGKHLADPALFDDRTWISATWTSDGITISALGHNEYQAEKFSGRCKFSTYQQCWYNSIVPLISKDGGSSFFRANYPTPIAASPLPSEAEQGRPRGYFSPTNIVFWKGYYFTLIAQSGFGGKAGGRCLFRNATVDDPTSWEAWDGEKFSPISGSAYAKAFTRTASCESISGIKGFVGSIGKLHNSNHFVAVALADASDTTTGGQISVYTSNDMLHWTKAQDIMAVTPDWATRCPSGFRYSYPSILSQEDEGRNFDVIHEQSSLFLTRISCAHQLQRDLLRFDLNVLF